MPLDTPVQVYGLPLVTALPPTPTDGQEVLFLAADAPGSAIWHLRYSARAAITDAYRWEFVGGTELWATANTNPSAATFPNGLWWDSASLTNGGPSITCPLAGLYHADFGARIYNGSAGVSTQMGVSGATAPSAGTAQVIDAYTAGVATDADHHASSWRLTVAASEAIRLWFSTTASSPTYVNRWLKVRPVRVG